MLVRLSTTSPCVRLLTLLIALGHDKAQSIIDQITAAYESGSGPPPGGFGFGPQHLGPPPAGGPPMGMGPPGGFGGPLPPPGFGGRKSNRHSKVFVSRSLTTSCSPPAFPSWPRFSSFNDASWWPSFPSAPWNDAPTWDGSSRWFS